MMKRERGITLIDLLVVVAFISILAAIFIPQMATFALRTYNAAAVSDLRNAVQAQETLRANWGMYGLSALGPLPGSGGFGPGMAIMGPGTESNPPILTLWDGTWTAKGMAIQLSDSVSFIANTEWGGTSYTMGAKHNMGDITFGVDSDSRALYRNYYIGAPNQTMYILQSTDIPPSFTGVVDFTAAMNWITM